MSPDEERLLCPRCLKPVRVNVKAQQLSVTCDNCQQEYIRYRAGDGNGLDRAISRLERLADTYQHWEELASTTRSTVSTKSASSFLRPVGYEFEVLVEPEEEGIAPKRLRYRVVGHGEVDAPDDDRFAGKREVVKVVEERAIETSC